VHQHVARAQLPIPRECPPLTEHFTGRETLIEELRKLLLEETNEPVTVLCGMGGVGKTTLAKRVSTLPEIESAFTRWNGLD
jgi:replication-associated recombination protein RarA